MDEPFKVGVTGCDGFIGWHLCKYLELRVPRCEVIRITRADFESHESLSHAVNECATIIHLAGVNRHSNMRALETENVRLAEALVAAVRENVRPPSIIYSSSTQAGSESPYGQGKLRAGEILSSYCKSMAVDFSNLTIPNVFGPFARPHYNSVVATFCHNLNVGSPLSVQRDAEIGFIYIDELVSSIASEMEHLRFRKLPAIRNIRIQPSDTITVVDLKRRLEEIHSNYQEAARIPDLRNQTDLKLFHCYSSAIDFERRYPKLLVQHEDERGDFYEVCKSNTYGQVSFSTTRPGVTRGNHFHTRKVERFSVVRGRARIEFRKVGSEKIYSFEVSGQHPSVIDMPIWHTHSIENIGCEDLLTLFWINEGFDQSDPDTFFDRVSS